MEHIKKSISINAPVEKVFDYISNNAHEAEWMPSLVRVFDSTGTRVGDKYKWKYKMAGIMLEGETDIMEVIPNKKYKTKTKGGIQSEFNFSFEPKGVGTELELDIDYKIPLPLVGKVAEKLVHSRNEREAVLGLQNVKEIMEN